MNFSKFNLTLTFSICIILLLQVIIFTPNSNAQDDKSSEIELPKWFKNNANWWKDGLISDQEIVNAIEYLVEQNIIRVSPKNIMEMMQDGPISGTEKQIPEYVKDVFGFWSKGEIPDSEISFALGYLIQEKIIKIPRFDSITNSKTISDFKEIQIFQVPSDTIIEVTNDLTINAEKVNVHGILFGSPGVSIEIIADEIEVFETGMIQAGDGEENTELLVSKTAKGKHGTPGGDVILNSKTSLVISGKVIAGDGGAGQPVLGVGKLDTDSINVVGGNGADGGTLFFVSDGKIEIKDSAMIHIGIGGHGGDAKGGYQTHYYKNPLKIDGGESSNSGLVILAVDNVEDIDFGGEVVNEIFWLDKKTEQMFGGGIAGNAGDRIALTPEDIEENNLKPNSIEIFFDSYAILGANFVKLFSETNQCSLNYQLEFLNWFIQSADAQLGCPQTRGVTGADDIPLPGDSGGWGIFRGSDGESVITIGGSGTGTKNGGNAEAVGGEGGPPFHTTQKIPIPAKKYIEKIITIPIGVQEAIGGDGGFAIAFGGNGGNNGGDGGYAEAYAGQGGSGSTATLLPQTGGEGGYAKAIAGDGGHGNPNCCKNGIPVGKGWPGGTGAYAIALGGNSGVGTKAYKAGDALSLGGNGGDGSDGSTGGPPGNPGKHSVKAGKDKSTNPLGIVPNPMMPSLPCKAGMCADGKVLRALDGSKGTKGKICVPLIPGSPDKPTFRVGDDQDKDTVTTGRDQDDDGVLDSEDICPFDPGPASNNGCPVEEPSNGDGDKPPDSVQDGIDSSKMDVYNWTSDMEFSDEIITIYLDIEVRDHASSPQPVEGVNVSFEISGMSSPLVQTQLTNESGVASFTFVVPECNNDQPRSGEVISVVKEGMTYATKYPGFVIVVPTQC